MGKNMVVLWSPKHKEFGKVYIVSVLPKTQVFVCLVLDEQFVKAFFSQVFDFTLVIRLMWKKNLPSNGFTFL